MSKTLHFWKTMILLSSFFFSGAAFAQVWNGSTVSTLTTGKVGIGFATPPDASLSIDRSDNYSPFDPSSVPKPALKIQSRTTSQLSAPGNIFEIRRSYPSSSNGFPPVITNTNELTLAVDNVGDVSINSRLRIGSLKPTSPYANYKLSVDGDIIAKRCVIQVSNWADYIFADNYSLPSLDDVETYVKEKKHLPGVPSEAEIKEKGVDMGEMNKILMQKVEELTLYIIDLKKEINALKSNQ